MTFSTKLYRSLKSVFVIGSVLAAALTFGVTAAPAQAQIDIGDAPVPVVGTWSRGARDTVAWVDMTNWKLITEVAGQIVSDPQPQPWVPVAGDWDGDGVDSVRMFHRLSWRLEPLEAGPARGPEDPHPCPWDPLVGDWDGDGLDTVSVYDRRDGSLHRIEEGPGRIDGYVPSLDSVSLLVGDRDGDGIDTIATVRNVSTGSESAWAILSGDWDGDGIDTDASLHLGTGELVHPELELEVLRSVAGGASSAAERTDDLSGIFDQDISLGGPCFKFKSSVQQKEISVSCMTIVITNWTETTCCPSPITNKYSCEGKLKGSVKTYGGFC
jgi:hypothetical protein